VQVRDLLRENTSFKTQSDWVAVLDGMQKVHTSGYDGRLIYPLSLIDS
jgi:hypothetical protein